LTNGGQPGPRRRSAPPLLLDRFPEVWRVIGEDRGFRAAVDLDDLAGDEAGGRGGEPPCGGFDVGDRAQSLGKVFTKLGIGSRKELRAALPDPRKAAVLA